MTNIENDMCKAKEFFTFSELCNVISPNQLFKRDRKCGFSRAWIHFYDSKH